MHRVLISREESLKYFDNFFNKSNVNKFQIAERFNVTEKSVRDWRLGKHSFPIKLAEFIKNSASISLPETAEIIDISKLQVKNARIGAIARKKKHGELGTPEGRSRGGKNSMIIQRRMGTLFDNKKTFPKLRMDNQMAELIGIILGDGSLNKHQVKIYFDKKEKQYVEYVNNLLQTATGEKGSIYVRKNVIEICVSGVDLCRNLKTLGLQFGNKVQKQVAIPSWIIKDDAKAIACVRGLFDTDGCVYEDNHVINGVKYTNLGLAYTSYSRPLLKGFYKTLINSGMNPTSSTTKRVMLRKKSDIIAFFQLFSHKMTDMG